MRRLHAMSLGLALVQASLLMQSVICFQFKVGDLDSWGIPTSSDPAQIYFFWSKYHSLNIGDSLLFLYPPSQDSVIQVTEQSYNSCNLKDPILYMNNGNSLFNVTGFGNFYFTSGVAGHCQKNQKLHVSVISGNGSSATANPPSDAMSPSYPTVFGGIPASANATSSSSSSSLTIWFPIFVAVFSAVLVSIVT